MHIKLKISTEALDKYHTLVKDNETTSEKMAILKLTRNVVLSKKTSIRDKDIVKCQYGNLTILIDTTTDTIIDIENKVVFSDIDNRVKSYFSKFMTEQTDIKEVIAFVSTVGWGMTLAWILVSWVF